MNTFDDYSLHEILEYVEPTPESLADVIRGVFSDSDWERFKERVNKID